MYYLFSFIRKFLPNSFIFLKKTFSAQIYRILDFWFPSFSTLKMFHFFQFYFLWLFSCLLCVFPPPGSLNIVCLSLYFSSLYLLFSEAWFPLYLSCLKGRYVNIICLQFRKTFIIFSVFCLPFSCFYSLLGLWSYGNQGMYFKEISPQMEK